MNAPSMRLFLALWPDATTRGALRSLQASLTGRLTRYEDLHLTLAFLGAQPATLVPALKEVLARLPRSEIVLTVDRLGYFTRNRIAWAGTHSPPQALLDLHGTICAAINAEAVQWKNERSFAPHITLARDADAPADLVFTPFVWRACEVALVQSETGPEGARYRVLATRRLDEDVRVPDPGEDAPI